MFSPPFVYSNKKTPLHTVIFVLLILTTLILIFIFTPMTVKGNSMYPKLKDGDIIVINRVNKLVDYNTIIVFKRNGYQYIKKIIALEGDVVTLKENMLLVNNSLIIQDDYLQSKTNINKLIVQPNNIFVIGDNWKFSKDSLDFGTINTDDIIGTLYFKLC